MATLGKKISGLRRIKKISQERLAEVLDVTRQTVYHWEADLSQPTGEALKAMADFFGVDVSYFFGDEISCARDSQPLPEPETGDGAYRIEKRKVKNIYLSVILILLTLCVTVCILVGSLIICDDGNMGFIEEFGITCLVIGVCGATALITVLAVIIKNHIKAKKSKSESEIKK